MAKRAAYGGLYVKDQQQTINEKKYRNFYIYLSTQDENGKPKAVGPLGKAAIDEATGIPFIDPTTGRHVPQFKNEGHVAFIYYDINKKEWVPKQMPTGSVMTELRKRALKDKAGDPIEDWDLEEHKKELEAARSGKKNPIVNLRPITGDHDIATYFQSQKEAQAQLKQEVDKTVREERKKLKAKLAKMEEEKDALSDDRKTINSDKRVITERKLAIKEAEEKNAEATAKLFGEVNDDLGLKGKDRITPEDVNKPRVFKRKRAAVGRIIKELVQTKGADEVRRARTKADLKKTLTEGRTVFGALATAEDVDNWLKNRELHIESEVNRDLALQKPDTGTTVPNLSEKEGAPAWYTDKAIMGSSAVLRLVPWHELDRPKGKQKRLDTINRKSISAFFHTLPGLQEAELYPGYDEFIKSKEYIDEEKTLDDFVLENISSRLELYTLNVNSDFYIGRRTTRDKRMLGVS